jgi:transposase
MIFSTRRTQILMSKQPTDMRLGYDGLHKLAKKTFGQNPFSGQYFAFVNRRRTSCKIYTWDGSGEVLICKRLSRGVFCRPNPSYKKQIRMTGSEFGQFFVGREGFYPLPPLEQSMPIYSTPLPHHHSHSFTERDST